MAAKHLYPNQREDSEGEVDGSSEEEEEDSEDDMSETDEVLLEEDLEEDCRNTDGTCGHESCLVRLLDTITHENKMRELRAENAFLKEIVSDQDKVLEEMAMKTAEIKKATAERRKELEALRRNRDINENKRARDGSGGDCGEEKTEELSPQEQEG